MDPSQVGPTGTRGTIGKVAPSADPTAKHCSVMGAEKIAPSIPGLQERVLSAYRLMGPMTDVELADFLGLDKNTVIPRRHELMEAGHVQKIGHRRNERTGVSNATWGLVG